MKPIQRSELATLILAAAILLGGYVRLNPSSLAGFAINDGGMFAVMVDDLRANGYALPAFTTYNHLDIPFAYPPLGFYLGALAADLSGGTAAETLGWLPALIASLSVPAFYLLALRLLKDRYRAALATLFFALMPRALSWYVMGGGLTRSPGQFFMLLTLAVLVRLYEENRRIDVLLAGLFGGLAVMSHPEAAVHTFVSAVFLWLMLSRRRETFVSAVLVGLVVLAVSAPWWGAVLGYHGPEPLLNGAATGSKALAVFHLLFFVFSEEPYVTVIAVLGLIGLAHALLHKRYLLPLWMLLPFLVEGRSAAGPAAIPLAMLAALGLVDVIFAALNARRQGPASAGEEPVTSIERGVLVYLTFYLLFSAYQFGFQLSSATLYPPDRQAMDWVRQNTPAEARFLVLTGTSSVSCDSVLEWFPALTGRQSLYTVQGTEWTKGPGFNEYVRSTYAVQKCLAEGDGACLDAAVDPSGYEYVYVSKRLRVDNCTPLGAPKTYPYFLEKVRMDPRFEPVYETADAAIFAR
jgi:hypothetical protein